MDIMLAYKAAQSKKGSIYDLVHRSELEEEHSNFIAANEYMDFVEFLQNELGFEEVKELQDKFYKERESVG